MTEYQPPNGDTDDELSYEDFDDDFVWRDPDDDLDVIDLDALEEEIAPDEAGADADQDADQGEERVDAREHKIEPLDAPRGVTPSPRPHFARPPRLTPAPRREIAPPEEGDIPEREPGAGMDAPPATKQDAAPPEPGPQETGAEAAAPTAEPAGAEEAPSEPPPPDWVYHVLIALPEALSVQVLELRATGDINDMPPPGIGLVDSFRTEDIDAVQEHLARWTRNHLPLQIEITGVLAEVVGQQQYVAAWLLQPEEELHDAQHDLRRALAPLIQPLSEARMALQVQLTIGDRVPPRRYPHLVGRMQREFEPFVWHATELLLVRRDADDDDGGWEVAQRYD